MARNSARAPFIAALCAVFFLLLTALPARADDASVTATANFNGTINVTGTVISGGKPAGKTRVFIQVERGNVYYIDTDASSKFATNLPATDTKNDYVLLELWAEKDGNLITQRNHVWVWVPSSGAGPTAGTSEGFGAGDSDQPVTLRAQLQSNSTTPGGVLQLTGVLLDAQGRGVSGMEVVTFFGDKELSNSTTLTGNKGHFSTFVEIPEDASPGTGQVKVTTPAVGGYRTSSTELRLTITKPSTLSPSPDPSPSLSPTPSSTMAAAASEASGNPSTQPTPTAMASPAPGVGNAWDWFLLGTTIIAGLALLAAIAIIGHSKAIQRKNKPLRKAQRSAEEDPDNVRLDSLLER